MKIDKQVVSRNIARLVAKTGKSRKEICAEMGIGYSTFSEWANGRTYPRPEGIEMLANYFRVSKSELIEDQTATPALIPLEEVGQKIRAQREQLGFSRKYISERTSLSEATLKRWESGTYNPMPDEAEQLSQILHLSREYLMVIQADEKNIRRQRFRTMLYEELPDLSLTDEEIRQVINYIKFVISQRT